MKWRKGGKGREMKREAVEEEKNYQYHWHSHTNTFNTGRHRHTHTNLHTDGIIRRPELLNTTLIKIQLTNSYIWYRYDSFFLLCLNRFLMIFVYQKFVYFCKYILMCVTVILIITSMLYIIMYLCLSTNVYIIKFKINLY